MSGMLLPHRQYLLILALLFGVWWDRTGGPPIGPQSLAIGERARPRGCCPSGPLSSPAVVLARLLHVDLRLHVPAPGEGALRLLGGALRRLIPAPHGTNLQQARWLGTQQLRSHRALQLRPVARLSRPRNLPARGQRPRVLGLFPATRPDDVHIDAFPHWPWFCD